VSSGRLNRVIAALERGEPAVATFVAPEVSAALALMGAGYDGIVFDTEHQPWDVIALRDSFQYLLDRREIFEADSLAPRVTPLVRIPPNGSELAQWHAKQALDLGAFGIIWPHVTTVSQAYNAVSACRYPRPVGSERYEPSGARGDGPASACRYWGITDAEYYRRADVWPLDPDGEILVAIMIEDVAGVENLPDILDRVPGIGLVLVGEGDLSQELGAPRQYEHPDVVTHIGRVVDACRERGVPAGHPHVTVTNVERVLSKGFRFLMSSPVTSHPLMELRQALTRRDA
jgi:4-hydroxy-2-oxoheptanedioate aldolase